MDSVTVRRHAPTASPEGTPEIPGERLPKNMVNRKRGASLFKVRCPVSGFLISLVPWWSFCPGLLFMEAAKGAIGDSN
jgi:hypothetical protein